MTDDTTNPIDAIPAAPGEVSPNVDNGANIISAPVSATAPADATAPLTALAAAVPTEVKETFLQKVAVDTEDAFHYLVSEIRKIYTSI